MSDDFEVFANEANYTAQAYHAHLEYMEGADGLPVQEDLDDRVTLANATHTPLENDEFDQLNSDDVSYAGVTTKVYTGGNVIEPVDDASGGPTLMETMVRTALDADHMFDRGGPIPPTPGSDASSYSPYVDGAWLAEGSKLTGEKYF